jgi:NCAIR mutase (PurE)-related protein
VNPDQLRTLLASVANSQISIDEALARLRQLPFERLDFATLDHHRALRCGHPEVIFSQGKTVEHLIEIARRLAAGNNPVLATRASPTQLAALRANFPNLLINDLARASIVNPPPSIEPQKDKPYVALISAGTADHPVAEESAITLRAMSVPFIRLHDVGVSGLQRLLAHVDVLQNACATIVAAGMEGALPSVVGGLCACPVYAVPTSVGYGASLGGLAALLGMLNSCASNVSVVNIDNGFGAAFSAGLVYRGVVKEKPGARSQKPE